MKWDAWVALGIIAQGIFFARVPVQWFGPGRAKQSCVPVALWYLSLFASISLLACSIHVKDPVFILGQSTGSVIRMRNIVPVRR